MVRCNLVYSYSGSHYKISLGESPFHFLLCAQRFFCFKMCVCNIIEITYILSKWLNYLQEIYNMDDGQSTNCRRKQKGKVYPFKINS